MHLSKAAWLNSLAFKILLAYIAGAMLSIALLVLFGSLMKDRLPGMELPVRTLDLARELRFDSEGQPVGFDGGSGYPHWIYRSLGEETAYRVLDENGRVALLSPGASSWPHDADISRLQRGRFEFVRNGVLHDGATEPFERAGRTWFMQLTVSSRIVEFLHNEFAIPFIRLGVITFSLVLLIVFGLCAYISLKYSLRPLRKASMAAAAISPRSLNERLEVEQVPSEIAPLIESFNQTLDRLEKGYRIQQEFLAKAAHELKTPLTLLRAEVELMEAEAGAREPLLLQVEQVARQVQQLLLLAEASESLSYRFADVDVHEVIHDARFFLQRIADDAQVNLTIAGARGGVVWRADRGAFFTLLKNLMENSIQHASPGTEVRIEIHPHTIRVRDRGPGIAQEHMTMMFQRFWRGTHRRDQGAGLGLAICREISLAHGWTLSAANEHPGLAMTIANENNAVD